MGISFAFLVAVVVSSTCNGFLFDVKTDCLVSPWSSWIDIPGLGTPVRERSILRYDNRGGLPCPPSHDLRQVKVIPMTATLPPQTHQQRVQAINSTAHSVVHNFLRRSMNVHPMTGHSQEAHFRDLLIILDSSGSIGDENYDRAKHSISQLLTTLCPNPDPFGERYHHAGFIVYSTNVQMAFDFREYNSIYDIQHAIENVPYMNGATCTTQAFNAAFNMMSPQYGMREDPRIDKEVLILTDGQSNCAGDVFSAVENLKKRARVFALLIGDKTPEGLDEMTSYVSSPVQDHLFALNNYKELDSLLHLVQSQSQPCIPLDVPQQNS